MRMKIYLSRILVVIKVDLKIAGKHILSGIKCTLQILFHCKITSTILKINIRIAKDNNFCNIDHNSGNGELGMRFI